MPPAAWRELPFKLRDMVSKAHLTRINHNQGHKNLGLQLLEVLIVEGIFALVNALASHNPGAQEFTALALKLLAT